MPFIGMLIVCAMFIVIWWATTHLEVDSTSDDLKYEAMLKVQLEAERQHLRERMKGK